MRRAGREVRLPSPHGDARFDLAGYDSHLDAHLGTGKGVMTSCEEDTCRTCEVRGVVGVPDPRGSAHADSEPGRNPQRGCSTSPTPQVDTGLRMRKEEPALVR
ncbi:2Fe-2S iron-sulfur cluster binding domain-containing protein [Rhodococcus koreensis]|uniref:2Fe-2S iron-sulfur cluster binding domain-containing protein n=1 Tax=Rhodococcus koreensis TaxID=99653 RepID=UPI003670AEDA